MISRYDVVIIGGGMVGLALAAALSDEKKVAVVEAKEPLPFASTDDFDLRVVALNRASQGFLQHLGAWSALEDMRVHAYERMHVWDSGGHGEIDFSAADQGEPDLGHIAESRLVQLALRDVVQSKSNVDWLCPSRVERFMVDDKETVVTLEDGSLLMSPLMVGADGARSWVREEAGIEVQRQHYAQQGIVATVRTSESNQATAWQRFQPDGVLAFLPLSNHDSSIVWSVEAERAKALLEMDDEAFSSELALAFDSKLGLIESVGPRAGFPLVGGQARQYVKPRLALVGDAAHTIHPLAGQGVNLGFMDAAELAYQLNNSQRDWGSLSVLRKYERARAGDNLMMQRLMEGFKLLYGNPQPAVKWLRNTGMMAVNGVGPLKSLMMSYALGTAGERPVLARTLAG